MGELLKVENITKIYPNGFVANKGISFSVFENEIHALVGENGAGKTTLMRILFGMEQYQEGAIYLDGKELHNKNALDAIKNGIGMIHQHFMLVPSLSIAENIVLGEEPTKGLFFDYDSAVKITKELADKYKFDIDVTKKVEDVSVGTMQKVEILKALLRGAKVIIMDEPTAVLTPQETRELFEQLLRLKDAGHSIIFISHKLEEIMELCDRVTILRKGKCLGTHNISDVTQQDISRMMIGRDAELKFPKVNIKRGEKRLSVNNVIIVGNDGKRKVDKVSFNVYEGEVLGIAGVEGSGQSELSSAITGTGEYHYGSISFNNKEVKDCSVKELRKDGMAYIPEDRMKDGASVGQTIRDNIIADRYFEPRFSKGLFLNKKAINEHVNQCIVDYEIACDDADEPVRMLSGGNIQKVVVAREFTSGCNFILASQPTRGIDVGTTEMIRKRIISMTHENNVGTLLISADLNELLEVSDRIIVMYKGQVVAAFPDSKAVDEDTLGEYMLGVKRMSEEEMEGKL